MTFKDEFNNVYLQSIKDKKKCLRVKDKTTGDVELADCANKDEFKWSSDGKKLSQCIGLTGKASGSGSAAKCSDSSFVYTLDKVEFNGQNVTLANKKELVQGTVHENAEAEQSDDGDTKMGVAKCVKADDKGVLSMDEFGTADKDCAGFLATYALDP